MRYDDSEVDDGRPPYLIRINREWGTGMLRMDGHEPFDTSPKMKLYCVPIMRGQGVMRDDSYDCLVLQRTTEEPGVFKRRGTFCFFPAEHNIDADKGWIDEETWRHRSSGGLIRNEKWFDGGEADAEGKYTIIII